MWTQCPDCQKKKNYIPVLSWFIPVSQKQCLECTRLRRLERQQSKDDAGQTIDREVVIGDGCHIYRKPHYQDSHM